MRLFGFPGLFLFLAVFLPAGVAAHFADGQVTRSIILSAGEGNGADPGEGQVEGRGEGGVTVYLRSPAPFLFGDVIAEAARAGTPLDSPFLRPETVNGAVRYRLLLPQGAGQGAAMAARLERALAWRQNGRDLAPRLLRYRITEGEPATPFTTAATADRALRAPGAARDPLFGESYVEAAFHLPVPVRAGPLELAGGLPALRLGPGIEVENLILDLRGEAILPLIRAGQLEVPVMLDGSSLHGFLAFVWQGILHILVGLDHVLLVVCFTLAATGLRRLALIVTAFTAGHSVTLVAGFLGYVPDAGWFVPAIEAAIAASVLFASLAVLLRKTGWAGNTGREGRAARDGGLLPVVAAIGLLHGLGFSFVLGDILGPQAPDLALLLAAFNIGVEIGQLAIVAIMLAFGLALRKLAAGFLPVASGAAAGAIALLSAWWVVERSLALI